MPYKFNDGRRRNIPKAKYRVTNWPDYDAALVRRGSLTLWVTEEAVAAWHCVGAGIEFRLYFSLSRLFYLTRTETGIPRPVMRLSTLQPIFASVF